MCNRVTVSTTSDCDLAAADTDRIAFVPLAQGDDPTDRRLAYPHRWRVSWMGGCSCGLRHVYHCSLGFGGPEDWYPEDEEDLANTAVLFRVLQELVAAGHRADLLDVMDPPDNDGVFGPGGDLRVCLEEVGESRFRLFTGWCFDFAPRVG